MTELFKHQAGGKMNKTLYVGIDVSKAKFDVAITHEGKKISSNATFENNLEGFKKLKSWIKKYSKGISEVHCCMESTGIYHEELAEFLQEEGFVVSVINPYQSKAFAGSQLLRTKNDKVDAGLLACYCAISQPQETVKIPDEVKKLRKLIRYLNQLIKTRAKEKTRLHSVKDDDVAHVVKATIIFLSQSIAQVEKLIKEHIKKHIKLRQEVELLKTIPGIGDKTAYEILGEIHIEDGKTINVKAQVAHAGLAPREYQSGSSVRGKPRICRTGNANLRKALYMPAMCAIQKNQLLSEFYHRLVSAGKPKMVALVATMRKLLVIAIGILRTRKSFDPNWAKIQQEKYLLCT
jgi:transposase